MPCIICGGQHDVRYCLYPTNIHRCAECQSMILNNSPHQCQKNNALKGYRLPVLAVTPAPVLKLRVRNEFEVDGADFHFFDVNNMCFTEFLVSNVMFSPSTSGLFTTDVDEKYNILKYESSKFVQFSFYIGIMKYGIPDEFLRVIVTRDGVLLFKGLTNMQNDEGKISMSSRHNFNTALILGLKPRSNKLQLQIQFGNKCQKIKWEKKEGWIFQDIDNGQQVLTADDPTLRCYNCNKGHNVENCCLPNFSTHCRGCLVVSFDGSGHENPCMPVNKISEIRSDILARNALTLFRLNYSPKDTQIFILTKDKAFAEFAGNYKALSAPAESILSHQVIDPEKEHRIMMKQTSFKRCSILFAVFDKANTWRLRFRLVVTPQHGLIVFKLQRTLQVINDRIIIPSEYENNSIALFGLKPKVDSVYMNIFVHANRDGRMSTTKFAGYNGYIGIDVSNYKDEIYIDDALNGLGELETKKFNRKLFQEQPKPLGSFKEQREKSVPLVNK